MRCHTTCFVQFLSGGLEMCSHSCRQEAEAKEFICHNHQVASCTDSLKSGRKQPLKSTNPPGVQRMCLNTKPSPILEAYHRTEVLCRPHLPPCLPRGPASAWGQLYWWPAAQAPVPACSRCRSGPAPRAAAAAAGWHPALSTPWWQLLCSHLPELLPGLQVMVASEVRPPAATSLQ